MPSHMVITASADKHAGKSIKSWKCIIFLSCVTFLLSFMIVTYFKPEQNIHLTAQQATAEEKFTGPPMSRQPTGSLNTAIDDVFVKMVPEGAGPPMSTQPNGSLNTAIDDVFEKLVPEGGTVIDPQLNVTKLFYNRIPKTGSTTFYKLLDRLKTLNNFNFIMCQNEPGYEHRFHYFDKIIKFVNKYFVDNKQKSQPKSVVVKHLLYLDFDRIHPFNITPKYINHVRSPISRFISNYNYMRFKRYHPNFTPEDFRTLPIDKCINTRHVECAHPNSTMVMVRFFCGHSPICLIEGKAAVNIAKRNIEKHYLAVGLLERMRDYLVVLEHVLPQFFIKVTQLFDKWNAEKKTVRNVTKWKQIPSKKETQKLKDLLRYDQEVYEFVEQRFAHQYKTIINTRTSSSIQK